MRDNTGAGSGASGPATLYHKERSMKIESEQIIESHTVRNFGKPDVSETFSTELDYKSELPRFSVQVFLNNYRDILFAGGKKIRVTIETVD